MRGLPRSPYSPYVLEGVFSATPGFRCKEFSEAALLGSYPADEGEDPSARYPTLAGEERSEERL